MSSTSELESTEDVCPHLGLAEDADSHATYATDAHRCYRLDKPTRIAPNHQERFCLSSTYTTCPIYQGEGIAATLGAPTGSEAGAEPASAGAETLTGVRLDRPGASSRPPRLGSTPRDTGPLGPRPRPGGISMRNLTIGIFVLAAVVLGFSFWLLTRGDDDDGIAANPTTPATATAATTTTPNGTATNGAETPGATVTGTASPGPGTPTSGGGGSTYIVQEGDTCSGIAAANNVELQDFLDANDLTEEDCLGLSVDQEVIIP